MMHNIFEKHVMKQSNTEWTNKAKQNKMFNIKSLEMTLSHHKRKNFSWFLCFTDTWSM